MNIQEKDTRIVKQIRCIKTYASKNHLTNDQACLDWVSKGLAKQYADALNRKQIYH